MTFIARTCALTPPGLTERIGDRWREEGKEGERSAEGLGMEFRRRGGGGSRKELKLRGGETGLRGGKGGEDSGQCEGQRHGPGSGEQKGGAVNKYLATA